MNTPIKAHKISAATEQQNNGDVAVEDDLKSKKAAVENKIPAEAANGAALKEKVNEDDSTEAPTAKDQAKATKRPADAKHSESKKVKAPDANSDDGDGLEEVVGEGDSDIDSDEYDISYDG